MMFATKVPPSHARRHHLFVAVLCGAFTLGCEMPQSITIESTPAGAAISVDNEYIGKSPVVYEISDITKLDRLRIVAERQNYESTLKLIRKSKHKNMFPEQVFLKLDPSMSVAEIKAASGSSGEQQQQTTMQGPTIQGPTIVVPGAGQVVPAPAPAPAP